MSAADALLPEAGLVDADDLVDLLGCLVRRFRQDDKHARRLGDDLAGLVAVMAGRLDGRVALREARRDRAFEEFPELRARNLATTRQAEAEVEFA